MRWALAIAVLGSTLIAQQPEIRLLARPAQPVFHLGETIELAVACIAAVHTDVPDDCYRAEAIAKANPDVQDITKKIPIDWTWSLLSPCIGTGTGFGSGGEGGARTVSIGPVPHWRTILLGPRSHVAASGRFEIEVHHRMIGRDPVALVNLDATTAISVVQDDVWTSRRLDELIRKLQAPKDYGQKSSPYWDLAQLEGESAMRAQAEYLPSDDSGLLLTKLENSTDQKLASELLRDRMLRADMQLNRDLLLTVTAMQARLDEPESFEAMQRDLAKPDAALAASALRHLRDNLHVLSRRGRFTLDRAVQFTEVVKQLSEPLCSNTAGFLSAAEAAELLSPIRKLRFDHSETSRHEDKF